MSHTRRKYDPEFRAGAMRIDDPDGEGVLVRVDAPDW